MTPILEVRGLSIAFRQYEAGTRQRSLPVIRDLSLTVGAGQIVAVVGSSGSKEFACPRYLAYPAL